MIRAHWILPTLLALAPFSSAGEPAPVPPAIVPVPNGGTPTPQPPQPAPIPTSIRVTGERFELLMLTNAGTAPVTWDMTSPTAFQPPVVLFELKPGTVTDGWRMGATAPAQYTVGDAPTVKVYATGDGAATLAAWGVQAGKPVKLATFAILANKGPQPPPKPPEPDPPEPKPPDPKPPVVTSFRVIWVYESGDTIPANQTAVMDAKAVRDYLNAKTTPAGGWAGWRQFDPQHEAANDTPIMKALWQSVKPHITTIPCMVVEVNGKAEIIPFPKSPAEALATLKAYGGP